MQVNRARDAVFGRWLPGLVAERGLRTAVDVGCGVGYYCAYLTRLGLTVTGLDARSENVEIARQCALHVIQSDIEQLAPGLGRFDLVFCAGLLYHLENPFGAIRNMRAICGSICVVESRVHWSDLPSALLIRDRDGPSQALRHYAWILSRHSIVGMLYASGFDYVYTVRFSSPNPELKRRAFFVATDEGVQGGPFALEPRGTDLSSTSYYYGHGLRRFWTAFRESFRWL